MKNFIIICLLVLLTSCQLTEGEKPHGGENIPKEFLGWWDFIGSRSADLIFQIRPDGNIIYYSRQDGQEIEQKKYYFLGMDKQKQELYLLSYSLDTEAPYYQFTQYKHQEAYGDLEEKVIRCNKYKLTDKDWQEQENQWLIQRFLAHNDCNVSIRIKYERHHHPFKDYTSRNGNVTISGDVYLPLKH